jgi:DNA-binding transcriptional LysR family regulator
LPLLGYTEGLAGPETAWLTRRYPSARFAFRSNSTQALVAAVAEGLGIAMLPAFVGDAEPTVRRLETPTPVPASELWVIAHRDAMKTARVQAVRGFLIELLRAERPRLEPG